MSGPKRRAFWAGGFLYDRVAQAVFLHQRDGNTTINPYRWAFFGGEGEGEESHLDCFLRELQEEIGLTVTAAEPRKLLDYFYPERNQQRVVYYVESSIPADRLTLGEGAAFAWVSLARVYDLDLADRIREDLQFFMAHKSAIDSGRAISKAR